MKKMKIIIYIAISFFFVFSLTVIRNKKMIELDSEQVIVSIPDEKIFLYYDDCLGETLYQGVYLKSASSVCFFDWEFSADMYHIPELTLLDNKRHLLIEFVKEDDGLYIAEAHMIDLCTMKEIFIQSPSEILDKNINIHSINYETGEVRFTYLNKEVFEYIDPQYLNYEIFSSISYDTFCLLEVINDTLIYTTYLQVSPSYSMGAIKISYIFKDHQYQMDSLDYISFS
ncbi:MAG: hypothetical protein J6B87_05275 [Clostridia bacterium]|nr:hypothetical protein [Clostridia bacterium]